MPSWTDVTAVPSSPRPRTSGAGAASSTVTGQPSELAVAATSRPMNPAPTTTTRAVPPAMRSRRAIESSSVRSSCTPGAASWPGNRRVREPVAMTSPSNGSSVPPCSVTVRPSTSSVVAATPRRRSSPSDSTSSGLRSRIRSGSQSPDSTFFDSGGRS